MTKEEAINKAIELEFGVGNIQGIRAHNSSLVNVAEHLYDLIQPSLPSNLDEEAKKEIERFCSDILNVDIIWARMSLTKKLGLQMAKFGAEWMAGQGETHELTVESPVIGPPMVCCPVHADNGDKVIVQIRKK